MTIRRLPTALLAIAFLAVTVGGALITTPTAPAEAAPRRTLMVLGDSYSSGEGLAPYVAGTDDGDNTCHRSDQSYGAVVAREKNLALVNRACSGAVIDDMYRDNPRNGGEIAQTKGVQVLGRGDIIALTIGGNDAKWTDLVADCTRVQFAGATHSLDPESCQRRKDAGPADVEGIAARLSWLYQAILDSSEADLRVLLYPPMIPVRSADATKDCSLQNLAELGSIGISADTSRRMVELELQLNGRIRQIVADMSRTEPRIRLVDVENEFGGYQGHTISCGFSDRPTPWINALRFDVPHFVRKGELVDRLRTTAYRPGSLHPTVAGQNAMAAALGREIAER